MTNLKHRIIGVLFFPVLLVIVGVWKAGEILSRIRASR